MAKLPPPPWFDIKTGAPTEPSRAWLQTFQNDAGTTSINSGAAIRQAEAAAAAAQAAADAAAQAAADAAAQAAFSAAAAPMSLLKQISGAGGATTASTTVTPTGGTGPYTYAWALVSGDMFTVNNPTAATTSFTTTLTTGQDKGAVYRCTVTDSLLATATCTVSVTASEIS